MSERDWSVVIALFTLVGMVMTPIVAVIFVIVTYLKRKR